MKFVPKNTTVDAFCFDGSFTGPGGVQAADDWVKSHDLEDTEVTCQGTEEPLALDVTTASGLRTIEAGDYLYTDGENLYAESNSVFQARFEPCDE